MVLRILSLPPWSLDLNLIDLYLWSSMKNVVYANIVDVRKQLCQCIQNAASKIHTTPGVFEYV